MKHDYPWLKCTETLTSVCVNRMSGYIMADLGEQNQQLELSKETVTSDVFTETPVEELTDTSENLEELEQKRIAMNDDAEKHKRLRDDLNRQTKEWISKRDALNGQVRELVGEAGKHRIQRDEFNQKVKESKVVRDELNQKVAQIKKEYDALKKDQPAQDKNQPSVRQLKKEFSDLETRQQTQVLKKKEEETLVKRLKEINDMIVEAEKVQEQFGDIREKSGELRVARDDAEKYHKIVSEYAEKAQSEHDIMIQLYKQADVLRKQADEAQTKFVECKKAADEEHKKLIEQIKSYHETDKDFSAIRNKQKAVRKRKIDAESRKAADDIFTRFKNGDKLSTEDLMVLQKSGYL